MSTKDRAFAQKELKGKIFEKPTIRKIGTAIKIKFGKAEHALDFKDYGSRVVYLGKTRHWLERAKANPGERNLITEIFTCADHQLKTVVATAIVYNGELSAPIPADRSVTFVPGQGFQFSDPFVDCTGDADLQGKILNKTSGCSISDDENLFSTPKGFYGFTDLARRCCALTDCYPKVNQALEEIKADFIRQSVDPSEPGAQR